MKALFFFIFSQGLWANTLLETNTAVGIANTLQGATQGNPQKVLSQVKDTVHNYEQAQQMDMSASIDKPISSSPSIDNPPQDSLSAPNNEVLEQSHTQTLNYSPPVDPMENRVEAEFDYSSDPMNNQNPRAPVQESYFKTEKISNKTGEDRLIDYKSSTQVFYKKDCLPSQSDCKRSGAVFTNIKSVIFNFAHSRGSFSENKK